MRDFHLERETGVPQQACQSVQGSSLDYLLWSIDWSFEYTIVVVNEEAITDILRYSRVRCSSQT